LKILAKLVETGGDGVCPNILAELCSQILALPGIRPDSFSVKLTRPTVTVGSQFEQFVSSSERGR